MTRTERSLVACIKRSAAEAVRREALIIQLHGQGYSLGDIRDVFGAADSSMSRSGIRGVLQRHGIDTSR